MHINIFMKFLSNISTKKLHILSSALFLGALAFFGTEAIVWAQVDQYTPLVQLPGIDTATANNLPRYLEAMFKLAIGLSALFAVVIIVLGGIQYMTSETLGGKSEGKDRIKQALSGLLLAIASYLILYTINPDTLRFNFNITPPNNIETQNPTINRPTSYKKMIYCQRLENNTATTTLRIDTGQVFFQQTECLASSGRMQTTHPGCPSDTLQSSYFCEAVR